MWLFENLETLQWEYLQRFKYYRNLTVQNKTKENDNHRLHFLRYHIAKLKYFLTIKQCSSILKHFLINNLT